MSWTPKQTEELKKQLASLNKLLGGKPAQWNSQQPNKGSGKGARRGGRRQELPLPTEEGWPKSNIYTRHSCGFRTWNPADVLSKFCAWSQI
eukprot:2136003-Amphidinium_carterae.1